MTPFELQACVRAAQAGDRDAFDRLVAAYQGVVYKAARSILQNPDEVDDLVQEVLLKIWQTLPQLREPERFAGWLRTTARNRAFNFKARRKGGGCSDQEFLRELPASGPSPIDVLVEGEVREVLREHVDSLGDLHREALDAFYWEEQSIEDISSQARAPKGTIRRRLHDARKRLGDRLVRLELFEERSTAVLDEQHDEEEVLTGGLLVDAARGIDFDAEVGLEADLEVEAETEVDAELETVPAGRRRRARSSRLEACLA